MHRFCTPAMLVLLALCAPSARAWEPILQHTGTNNPANEGWSVSATGPTVPAEGFVDGGTPVWWMSGNGSGGSLRYSLSSLWTDTRAKVRHNGWRVSARLRIPTASDPLDNSAFLFANTVLPDGTFQSYLVLFASDASANMQVYPYGAEDSLYQHPRLSRRGDALRGGARRLFRVGGRRADRHQPAAHSGAGTRALADLRRHR
jgi:hypothetical protein